MQKEVQEATGDGSGETSCVGCQVCKSMISAELEERALTDVEKKAVGMALRLRCYCKENNIHPSTIIAGVAWDADRILKCLEDRGKCFSSSESRS